MDLAAEQQPTDWGAWHDRYDDPGSSLAARLAAIQGVIGRWLDRTAPRPVRVASACAGEGRDLLGVLEDRDDAARVEVVLLEADPALARTAAAQAQRLALPGVEVRCADAGSTRGYAGAVPADLVLLCGVFGNISDVDVHRTIRALPQLCAPDALVVWTRHRGAPDPTPTIRRWFAEQGCEEQGFVSPGEDSWAVGVHRFRGRPQPLEREHQLFTFLR
ncbi:SAM-dependent methyltransferase [Nocardioides panaciterrulae]|uniref:SAM-dependent methyltransferase n=1 Tax=Nocardioides panaciterrulae TaxID=661492 RepID=A0A7Y9J8Y9_9ACTN|nr:SAM-dependent methyltransferase [Nocardioides panaciterrulae]NYD40042.1 hypothetical protein [Nocardioides panaciterrulae]